MANTNIITRARAALSVFQHGYPRQPWPTQRGAGIKAMPYAWPSWRENVPQWNVYDLAAFVTEGFTLNSVIYSAVMYKAKAAATPPMRAYNGDVESPDLLDADHPLQMLCTRPNRFMSWGDMQLLNTIYLNISGNVFVYADRKTAKDTPDNLWPLRPDRVYIVPGKGGIKGYAYIPEGRSIYDAFPILPQDMIHVKLPNPSDPFEGMGYGLSPIGPMAKSADVDNAVTSYIKLFFDNGAMPPGYLTFKGSMETGELTAARKRWEEVYGGWENWAKVVVLDSEGEYKRAGLTFDELAFEGLDYRNEERMSGPFGVPAALIGLRYGLENSGIQANLKELRSVFWEDTMLHELRLFQEAYAYHLNTEAGEFIAYDLSEVPALRRDIAPLVDAAYKLWTMGVPANQALAKLNVPIGEVPGGDVGYLPLSVLPVGATPPTAQPNQQGQQNAPEDERQAGKTWDAFAEYLVKAVDRIIETYPKEDPRP